MSDLSLRLQQSASQLPVDSYFDEALYRIEQERIFRAQARYVGHVRSVPEVGDFYTLPQEGGGRALVRTPTGVQLISNVCRHRQALILQGRGNLRTQQPGSAAGNLVCPLHRWTYSGGDASTQAGTLIGAPHFAQDPCLDLENYPLQEWNGLLFEPPKLTATAPACATLVRAAVAADLARLGPVADLDFSG
ncbi:MAG: Rieske (2Fe-2S) protein, partial [Burkholderiaceae bacterium]